MTPLVYAWPGCESLAAALAARCDGTVAALELRRFPDGEAYVRLLASPKDRDVIFACGLEHPDDKVCSLLFAADTARELGALRIGLAAPYLCYMRQDARFNPGEAIASRTFARWLSQTVDWLVTMDPHLHRHHALSEIYTIPSAVASSTGPIARWISQNIVDPLLIGPDAESAQWVSAIADRTGSPWVALRKERRGDRDVDVSLPDISTWPGRTPVLVDDIVSTAHTMAAAVRHLHRLGAPAPTCIGVHALFCDDALAVLRAAGPRTIITCNTIPHETNAIDVTGEIAGAVATLIAQTGAQR